MTSSPPARGLAFLLASRSCARRRRRRLAAVPRRRPATACSRGDRPRSRPGRRAGPRCCGDVPLGDGYSGMTVAGGRLYTLFGERRATRSLAAFDAATGKRALARASGPQPYDDDWAAARARRRPSTATSVYVLGAARQALRARRRRRQGALEARPARRVRGRAAAVGRLDLAARRGRPAAGRRRRLGAAARSSPSTRGPARWSGPPQTDQAGYSAPIAITVERRAPGAVLHRHVARLGCRRPDGKLLWRVPWQTSYDVNAATPIFVPPDKVFVSSGYDIGAALCSIEGAGRGRSRSRRSGAAAEMKNQFSTSVLHGGLLYGFDDKTLKCHRRGHRRGALEGSAASATAR